MGILDTEPYVPDKVQAVGKWPGNAKHATLDQIDKIGPVKSALDKKVVLGKFSLRDFTRKETAAGIAASFFTRKVVKTSLAAAGLHGAWTGAVAGSVVGFGKEEFRQTRENWTALRHDKFERQNRIMTVADAAADAAAGVTAAETEATTLGKPLTPVEKANIHGALTYKDELAALGKANFGALTPAEVTTVFDAVKAAAEADFVAAGLPPADATYKAALIRSAVQESAANQALPDVYKRKKMIKRLLKQKAANSTDTREIADLLTKPATEAELRLTLRERIKGLKPNDGKKLLIATGKGMLWGIAGGLIGELLHESTQTEIRNVVGHSLRGIQKGITHTGEGFINGPVKDAGHGIEHTPVVGGVVDAASWVKDRVRDLPGPLHEAHKHLGGPKYPKGGIGPGENAAAAASHANQPPPIVEHSAPAGAVDTNTAPPIPDHDAAIQAATIDRTTSAIADVQKDLHNGISLDDAIQREAVAHHLPLDIFSRDIHNAGIGHLTEQGRQVAATMNEHLPKNLHAEPILPGSTVGKMLVGSYPSFWTDPNVLGAHIIANYNMLSSFHDQVLAHGAANLHVLPHFPSMSEVHSLIAQANTDPSALNQLQEALHWVPAGGTFDIVPQDSLSDVISAKLAA